MKDLVHQFNAAGLSVLTEKFLCEENDRLRQEIATLKRNNRTLALRLRTIAEGADQHSLNS